MINNITVEIYKHSLVCIRHKDQIFPEKRNRKHRNPIVKLSRASQKNLNLILTNFDKRYYMVLTYPDRIAPGNYKELMKDCRAIQRHLSDQGLSGVYVFEFKSAGVPHINILLNKEPDMIKVNRAWQRILRCKTLINIYCERITGQNGPNKVKNYLLKMRSKTTTEAFGLQRWWGQFGKDKVKPETLYLTGEDGRIITDALDEIVDQRYIAKSGLPRPRTVVIDGKEYDARPIKTYYALADEARKLIQENDLASKTIEKPVENKGLRGYLRKARQEAIEANRSKDIYANPPERRLARPGSLTWEQRNKRFQEKKKEWEQNEWIQKMFGMEVKALEGITLHKPSNRSGLSYDLYSYRGRQALCERGFNTAEAILMWKHLTLLDYV